MRFLRMVIVRDIKTGEACIFPGNIELEILGMEAYITKRNKEGKEETLCFSLHSHDIKTVWEKGVNILLAPRTRIPLWITNQSLNVAVEKKKWGRSLKVRGGKASFGPGDAVYVKMPGSNESWAAFRTSKVLAIHRLSGKLIEKNHRLCDKCFKNTGTRLKEVLSPGRVGREDVTFQCSICGNIWEFKAI